MVKIERHQFFIDLDDLVDQRAVRGRNAGKIGIPGRIEKTVGDGCAVTGGQVDRQALLAESFLNFCHQRGQIDIVVIDFIHHDDRL